jgi:hypothetical protein
MNATHLLYHALQITGHISVLRLSPTRAPQAAGHHQAASAAAVGQVTVLSQLRAAAVPHAV